MVLTRIASNLFRSSSSYPYGYPHRSRDRSRSISVTKYTKIRGRERDWENSPPQRPFKRLKLMKSIASLRITEEDGDQEQQPECSEATSEVEKAKRRRARARARAYASSISAKRWTFKRAHGPTSRKAQAESTTDSSMRDSSSRVYTSHSVTSSTIEPEAISGTNSLGLSNIPLPTSPPCNIDIDDDQIAGRSETPFYSSLQHSSVSNTQSNASSSRHVQMVLPRRLHLPTNNHIPPNTDITAKALAHAYPVLANIPVEYVRRRLWENGYRMMNILARTVLFSDSFDGVADVTSSTISMKSMPKSLYMSVHPNSEDDEITSSDLPTHILAVYGSGSSPLDSKNRAKASMYPIHDIVLLAQCTYPLLVSVLMKDNYTDKEESAASKDSRRKGSLPVISLRIPSPQTFGSLLKYLYCGHLDDVDIFSPHNQPPSPPSTPTPCGSSVAFDYFLEADNKARESNNLQNLMKRLATINGIWRNACALGIIGSHTGGSGRVLQTMLEGAWVVALEDVRRLT